MASKQPNFENKRIKFNKPSNMADITKIQINLKISKISKIPQNYNRHSLKQE